MILEIVCKWFVLFWRLFGTVCFVRDLNICWLFDPLCQTFAVLILACKVKGGFTLRSKSNRGVIDRHGRIAGEIHFENLACSAASQSVHTSQALYSNKHLAGGRTTFLSLPSTTFEFTFL